VTSAEVVKRVSEQGRKVMKQELVQSFIPSCYTCSTWGTGSKGRTVEGAAFVNGVLHHHRQQQRLILEVQGQVLTLWGHTGGRGANRWARQRPEGLYMDAKLFGSN
jgi:hypothetical protein